MGSEYQIGGQGKCIGRLTLWPNKFRRMIDERNFPYFINLPKLMRSHFVQIYS